MPYNQLDMLQNIEFKTANVNLPNGWSGLVALSDSKANSFTAPGWAETLADIEQLCTSRVKKKSTIVKDIEVGNRRITVAIKRQSIEADGLKNMLRSLARAKAIRNFNSAKKLLANGIPTARPLAAIERRNGPATLESIYISEYLEDSKELYFFARDNFADSKDELELKRLIGEQIGRIFANLHKAGLWHRDAKASNIVIYKASGEYRVSLVDMDGIKRYCLWGGYRRDERRYRWFSKLVATLEGTAAIDVSDHLHCFDVYCKLCGIDKAKQDELFQRLMRQAVAVRLLIMANTAMAK